MTRKRPAAELMWNPSDQSVEFEVLLSGRQVPPELWAEHSIRTDEGQLCRIGPLLRLLEDEVAQFNDGVLRVPHLEVAKLSHQEARDIGLPPDGPFSLEVSTDHAITAPDSVITCRFWHPAGFPVTGVSRLGSILSVDDETYRLVGPAFLFLEGIDAFNEAGGDVRRRLEEWGRVSRHLPDDALVDDYLRTQRVVFVTSFKMEPFANEDGEAEFRIIPGWRDKAAFSDEMETEPKFLFREGLPSARQEDFDRRFMSFRDSRDQYAVGGGWQIVLEEPVRRVLGVARGMMDVSPEERREFILHPHSYFRTALEEDDGQEPSDDIDQVLADVFWDEGYSERVSGIGIWQPKVLPWLTSSGESWLPGEDLGVRVGDHFVRIDADRLQPLRDELASAMECGLPAVDFDGHRLPATQEALDALDSLIGRVSPDRPPEPGSDEPFPPTERVVLIVKENFEEVDYERTPRPAREAMGRLPGCVDPERPLPHQLDAFNWLQNHWREGSPGALLADDMGLGKTFVGLLFLAWIREQMGPSGNIPRRPLLTVAPTALLDNWQDEADKHLGGGALGRVFQARGNALRDLRLASGSEQNRGLPVLDVSTIQSYDWVLTTYETWRDYQLSFNRVSWAVATFDEVQKVKNPAAALTDAAKATKAEFVLALTGTPVENRLADLWCIVDLVQPGRLGPLRDFSRKYEVETGDDSMPEVLKPLKDFLQEQAPAIMKRRLKEDHLQGLPEKQALFSRRDMPAVQADTYADRVGSARMGGVGRGGMLETLGSLRSISLHPGRTGQENDDEFIQSSARLIESFEILDRVALSGEKALVFLESREMQGILSEILQRRYELPGPPLIINGAVSGQKRHERVKEFQGRKGFDVMVISPKAGGVGLTLTAANHVIHLSRWWNPAVEDQCTDRVYRIGQERVVTVYHPIAVHPEFGDASFDMRLDDLLRRKRRLSREVLAPPAATADDFSRLFDESVTQTSQTSASGKEIDREIDLTAIDIMEPEAFERWALDQFRGLGYRVQVTPRSGDVGADGIALAPDASTWPNFLIQCKHTQGSGSIGPEAVEEVVRSRKSYSIPEPLKLLVVSNAVSYSASAKRLAREFGVALIRRDQLGRLSKSIGI